MELIDNISRLLGDDLKQVIRPGGTAADRSLVLRPAPKQPKNQGAKK
ncbi:hypothetical protein [Luteibacter yeojuensis]|uniref:Uncharacterized protein n=1 Tax=Luteibacter yeojuensis TaxID=345309 RepID=A0A7X5TQC9_9GAMM|nr:hypothetical protein [Luteibacter yeojuensis]NID15693.1 hypothetical protein [Luteibacter yeojuensis]